MDSQIAESDISDKELGEYDHEWGKPGEGLYSHSRILRRFVVFAIDQEDLSYLMKPEAKRFDSYDEAERYIAELCQCESCSHLIDKGVNPRSTCCYSLMCIWSERRLRRDLNGAWSRQRDKSSRREYDRNYKRRRRR